MIQNPKVMAAMQAMMTGGAPDLSDPDVAAAMAVTKPSAVLHLQRYVSWSDQYGQTG